MSSSLLAGETGSGWFYSHDFNQRLVVDGGTYYTLAHGDAYSRRLGFAAFTKAKYLANDSTVFDQGYWEPMLVVAGIIEGFVSPSGLATPLKFLLAAVLFAALAAYLARPGTPPPEAN